jgi:hypothetical protein
MPQADSASAAAIGNSNFFIGAALSCWDKTVAI